MSPMIQTEVSMAFLIVRLGLAVVFFAHGSQQLLGWFGGVGPKATVTSWNERYGLPVWLCVIGILTEFFGSFAMLLGFLTRPFALGLVIFMAVAIWKAHWKNGFFLARRAGEGNGIEFCLMLFLMAIALLIGGAGSISIDRWLSN
jgi:putative oxidoreductase